MIRKFKEMPLFNKVRFCICTGVILLSIIVFVFGQIKISELSDQHDADLKLLAELNATPDELMATMDEISPTENGTEFKIYSSKEKGDYIADVLTNMQVADEEDLSKLEYEFSNCFVIDSMTGIDFKNVFGNSVYHNIAKDTDKKIPPHWTWYYISNYKVASNTMSAVWLCKDDATGVLLAGITANYNAITDKFYNLATFETKTGQNYQSARYTIDKDLIPVTEPVTEISETTVENSEGSKVQ